MTLGRRMTHHHEGPPTEGPTEGATDSVAGQGAYDRRSWEVAQEWGSGPGRAARWLKLLVVSFP